MFRTSFLHKIFLVVFSFFLVVIVLETGLRFGGMLFLKWQDYVNRRGIDQDGVVRIMCVGESTTALGGEFSYPSQLEVMLNESGAAAKFHVINKGVPMTNTGIIREQVGKWMTEYHPDMIIFMMGINDHNDVIPVDLRSAQQHSFWKSFRVYRLALWFKKNLEHRDDTPPGVSFPKKLSYVETMRAVESKQRVIQMLGQAEANKDRELTRQIAQEIKQLSQWIPDNEDVYSGLGMLLLKYRWYEDLPEVIDYFFDRNHRHAWLHGYIVPSCRDPQSRRVIVGHFLERIQKNPTWQSHEFLGACYAHAGFMDEARAQFQQSAVLQRRMIDPVTQRNYVEILNQVRQNNIPFILVQYPMREVQALKVMLQDQVNLSKIIFVDNQDVFEKAVEQGGYETYFIDRFGGNFGHCTPEGNRILAENVARAVLKLMGKNS